MSNIPKIIHYCWFGNGEKSKLANKCMESWRVKLKNYEIIEWNEKNFDINCNKYVKEAYYAKKYAFVSDYVRLFALYNYGGIYLDTDVEVIKSLDEFLIHEAFAGFESEKEVQTGLMACKKGNKLFGEFLKQYEDRTFVKEDNIYDLTPNVVKLTEICEKYGLEKNNKLQIVNGLTIYPKTYFCPLNFNSDKSDFSSDTHLIHHFAGSWISEEEKKRIQWLKKYSKRKEFLCQFMGEKNALLILNAKANLSKKFKNSKG